MSGTGVFVNIASEGIMIVGDGSTSCVVMAGGVGTHETVDVVYGIESQFCQSGGDCGTDKQPAVFGHCHPDLVSVIFNGMISGNGVRGCVCVWLCHHTLQTHVEVVSYEKRRISQVQWCWDKMPSCIQSFGC